MKALVSSTLRRCLDYAAIRALLPLAVVVALGCVFNQQGAFFEYNTHRDMLREISVVGILACGMTVVIITAGIDLSVGSVLALSAVCFALLTMPLGYGGSAAILAVLAIGALAGAANGVLVACARIQAAVDSLSEDQREIFLMREHLGLPFKEIAEIVGIPENTAKSRMRYALEKLRAELAEFEDLAQELG